jgi:hypothetical protein
LLAKFLAIAATSLCRQLQRSMYGWSIKTNLSTTAKIDKVIASLIVRVMQPRLDKQPK